MTLPDRSVTLRILVELLVTPGHALTPRAAERSLQREDDDRVAPGAAGGGRLPRDHPERIDRAAAARRALRTASWRPAGGSSASPARTDARQRKGSRVNKKILVLGGGVAGSSMAYYLTEKGYDVTVVEKNSPSAASRAPVTTAGIRTSSVRTSGSGPAARRIPSTRPSSSSRTTSCSTSIDGCSRSSSPMGGSIATPCTTRTSSRCPTRRRSMPR